MFPAVPAPERRRPALLVLISLSLFWAARALSVRHPVPRLPSYGRPPVEERAVADLACVLMGLRRFGADLAYIQLLQYIMTPAGELDAGYAELIHPKDSGRDRTFEYALRVIQMDPDFRYAYHFSSALLAFHLKRYDEALAVLEKGMAREPSYWGYRLYAGAIGFQSREETSKVTALLEEAVRRPDCPTMVMNILAFLYEGQGNFARAIELYLEIAEHSRDAAYARKARNRLEKLRVRLELP
ncbi:MAG: hypothetical protein A2902_00885 [Elusimicrobia bacterium RIFCSPLOWO2_01_FULL_64_13]|nr:MAG: hypothetical protein A2636_01210 [Elusimicrobia bacterium RIFCSPHIGHO2_01_FULL_64_10]OGR97859.1 MAG: hypothetical protein A2902_00885 [Elusimicrobia bacterium RIFCSPLOWO2_01_FULL_64_13]